MASTQGRAPQAPGDGPPPKVSREIAAEAAVWVARLHGPGRTRAMERECLAWQARSPAHRHAFERCTETWLDVPGVTVAGAFAAAAGARKAGQGAADSGTASTDPDEGTGSDSGGSMGRRALLALAVAAVAATLWWQPWQGGSIYETGIGELHAVVLDDGSRVSLNTDTRLQVRYGRAERSIDVLRGEALFEVARDPARPFVVQAAGSEVRALGTVFSVRLTPQGPAGDAAVAVTLLEGQVSVRAQEGTATQGATATQPVLMTPGDRLRVAGGTAIRHAAPQIDRPPLEQVTAWKRSEALFDNTTLAEAVAEMNRYSRTPIVLAGELTGPDWRISGQYRAGDNAGFARAVAAVHGLALRETPGRLELARSP